MNSGKHWNDVAIRNGKAAAHRHPLNRGEEGRNDRTGTLRNLAPILVGWIVLRLLTSLWAARVSSWRPLTEIEGLVPVWPPSVSWTSWLERVALAPWQRWDAVIYMRIVTDGYRSDDGTAAFHPLFPWLAVPLERAGLPPLLSLLIVSSAACLILLVALEKLALMELRLEASRSSVFLLLSFPSAFIFFAPYSESLFLSCAVMCFFWARRGAWWLAGLAGALATLTRQQGVFLVLPLAWELHLNRQCIPRRPSESWQNWLAVGLIPAAMLLWIAYRAFALSDFHPDASSVHTLIYSTIISPSAGRVATVQQFIWPWKAAGSALHRLWTSPDVSQAVDLTLGTYFIGLLVVAWRGMRMSYRLYSAVVVLVSLSFYTGPVHPYMGLPRHLMLAFPVFVGLGGTLSHSKRLLLAGAGLAGMFFLLFLYVLEAWVP